MSQADWVAILSSWQFSPMVLLGLTLSTIMYMRGWWRYRQRRTSPFSLGQAVSYVAGMLVVFVALQSPLDTLAGFSLQVHMIQHLLLMIVAPPLLLYSAPMLPMIAGLPKRLRDGWITPFATWRPLRRGIAKLVHPAWAWCLFVASLWIWHAPYFYGLALESDVWHRIEHGCFLATSVLFWWPVVQPYPSRLVLSQFWLVPYLFLAGAQGTALAGILTFSDHVLYANYETTPSLWGIDPLTDQAVAGAIMWVPMSLAFLIGLVCVVSRLMAGGPTERRRNTRRLSPQLVAGQRNLPVHNQAARTSFALAAPFIDAASPTRIHRLFRSGTTRMLLRVGMFVLALLVIIDGIRGPQVSPLNLAGVLPWIHWRGILVLTLLVGGNFFCMACPFTSLQKCVAWLARVCHVPLPRRRQWPITLQNKWLAIGTLALFFWAYEAFALWDRPFWTAMIAIGFFVTAVGFELFFVHAPFCKYVCPIGQFNFVHSMISPTEIAVTDSYACSNCRSKDCIVGNASSPGCQTQLFQPRKHGNMDCTFCFDCVTACPHDNVALISVPRTLDLTSDRSRSSIRRYSERPDLAAVIVFLFFASLVNAAWMTGPVLGWEDQLVQWLGVGRLPVLTLGLFAALIVAPWIIVTTMTRRSEIARFAPALIPLGFGMWLAHYSFHFFTSADAIQVAGARMWSDWTGGEFSAGPVACCCCRADSIAWLLPLELVFLGVGFCMSFVVSYRIAHRESEQNRRGWRPLLPWICLMVVFYFSCVWVLLQPMQMRGALMTGM